MVVFVVLHYQDADITYKCVAAIEKVMREVDYHIIIVDNASPDEIGRKIKKYYKANKHCTVILNQRNLGFAQGNNIGYLYAKKHYSPQYIIVMNNDVIIEDVDFPKKVEKISCETEFDILGPNIIRADTGQRQNPMRSHYYEELQTLFKEYRKRYKYPLFYFSFEVIQGKIREKLLKRERTQMVKHNEIDIPERMYNPVLHGACYICAKRFIDSEDALFDPRTFLYWEEYLLWLKCYKKKYTLVYDPSVSVLHLSGYSTVKAQEKAYKRTKTFYQNYYDSLKILIETVEKEGCWKLGN